MKTLPLTYPDNFAQDFEQDYFGTLVSDQYRWLEGADSVQKSEWIDAQNNLTNSYLDNFKHRASLLNKISELMVYNRFSEVIKVGEIYYYLKNDGTKNQNILYSSADFKDETVVLDPNLLSKDGLVAISGLSASKCGRYLSYVINENGSDFSEIKLIDLSCAQSIDTNIKWVKFSKAEWVADSSGFFFSSFLSDKAEVQTVCFYSLENGISQIFGEQNIYSSALQSECGNYDFIFKSKGTHGDEIMYKSLKNSEFKVLKQGYEWDYSYVFSSDDKLFVLTNENAPWSKVVAIDLTTGESTDLVAEVTGRTIEAVQKVEDLLILNCIVNAQSVLMTFDVKTLEINEITLPEFSTVVLFPSGIYQISSYLNSPEIYSIFEEEPIFEGKKYNENFATQQVFCNSKDGTKVSMFVTKAKGEITPSPLYLYGYGGFNISLTPNFRPVVIALLQLGLSYVDVNLRGGGEYGEQWHRAGMLESKQNVFDDFISSAEFLISQGYTTSDKLAIAGGSNGGLLVGACLLQRPDLFAVALPAVGVLDMLRYHLFTVGWGWMCEYGSSEKKEEFEWIYKYSPLHNIGKGQKYPPTFITTGDHDDRVVPAHSFKFAAKMQDLNPQNVTLIRVEKNAGHGMGKPLSKVASELADQLAFMLYNTNTKYNG